MKKLITLTLALLASGSLLFAQVGRTNAPLQLRLTDNSPITVSVDGANYTNEGGVLSINNVSPGEHEIQVFRGALREGAKVPVLKTFRVTTTAQGTTFCMVDPVSGSVDIQAGRGGERGDRGAGSDRGSGGDWGSGDRGTGNGTSRGDRNGDGGGTGQGNTGTTGTSGNAGNEGTRGARSQRDVYDPANVTNTGVKPGSNDFNRPSAGQGSTGNGMQGSTGGNNTGNNGYTGNENGRNGNGQNGWVGSNQNNNNSNNNNGYSGNQQGGTNGSSYNNGSTQYGGAQSNGNGGYQQGQNWNNAGNQQGQGWGNGGYNGQNDRGSYQGNGGYANQNDRWGNQGGGSWNNDGRGTHRRWQNRDRDDRNNDRWNDDRSYNDRNRDRDNDDRSYETPEPELVLLKAKDITAIKAKVAKKTTDAAKNTVLQAEIGDRAFTVEQGRGMLRLLKGETERLKFARWAIDATIDVENFAKLATEFKLAASKREIKKLAEEAAQD